jgi:hypothetical protein
MCAFTFWYFLYQMLVIRWIAFLPHIQEIPGLNLTLVTGYPDWGFVHGFSQFLQVNAGIVP